MPIVSAVICTRNRPDLIGTAATSVLANTYTDFELLVVDQSDDDRTGAVVRGLMADHPNLRYVHSSRPGLSRAYNIAVRETGGELLAFTDDDCVAPPDWIATIVGLFGADPDVEMLQGQVVRPAALTESAGVIPTLPIDRPQRLNRRDGFQIWVMGANLAARRRLFDRIGGFDELLGGGGPLKSSQDQDFQYRAYLAGATVRLSPEVRVDHYGVRDPEQWRATLHAYGFGDAAFYMKHIRCGDLLALGLVVRWVARLSVRELLNPIRHKQSYARYLWAYLDGIRGSLRYPVDRRRRLYLQG
jgi:glycosyltransferase involved in cell wall biosynthesis